MCRVVRILVAGPVGISSANPRLHLRNDLRLESALEIGGEGFLRLSTPTPRLHGSPRNGIDRADTGGEGVNTVPTECLDLDVVQIAAACCRRAIVRLQNMPPVLVIEEEHPCIRRVPAFPPFFRVGAITEGDAIPSPTVNLKNSTRGDRTDEGEIGCRFLIGIMHAIKT